MYIKQGSPFSGGAPPPILQFFEKPPIKADTPSMEHPPQILSKF